MALFTDRSAARDAIAALLAGLALSVALPACAEPDPASRMRLINSEIGDGNPAFLAHPGPARTGDTVEIWLMLVFPAPQTFEEGVTLSAVWSGQQVNCATHKYADLETVAVSPDLAVILRDPPESRRWRSIDRGSRLDQLQQYFCDGVEPEGMLAPGAIDGVAAAVSFARTPGFRSIPLAPIP